MPGSEAAPKIDKPPSSVPAQPVSARTKERVAPVQLNGVKRLAKLEQPPELDEFGLRVKKNAGTAAAVFSEDAVRHDDHAGRSLERTGAMSGSAGNAADERLNGDQDEVPTAPHPVMRTREGAQNGKPALADSSEADVKPQQPVEFPKAENRVSNGPILPIGGISEWSHQVLAPQQVAEEAKEPDEWKAMPAYGHYDHYDDDGNLVAKAAPDSEDEELYQGLGGAGRGYTRVQIDDDARSATSMDENTSYLFKEKSTDVIDEYEEQRDPLAQLQATKDLLTEGQRIAYVGVTRLAMHQMFTELEIMEGTKATKKETRLAAEHMRMWGQKMAVRLYAHMDIDTSEQLMIEQLAEHGVQPSDLTPALMQNARVRNPMAEMASAQPSTSRPSTSSPHPNRSQQNSRSVSPSKGPETESPPPPPYEDHKHDELPDVRSPSMLPTTTSIDIDLRWTVLCDLFLVLISDQIYDSRSRQLLERVGASLDVPWLEICRFEKRVTDALEMQEAANKENWDESEHMENRRKMALKKKYMMMGLATVGGSLVIGLSAGLLAPVIGAGLAAGFTTIGIAGTGGFLGSAGSIALITSGAVVTGGTIGVRASHRRTGAVKTFEYRPLHNNKRVNLIVTVAGWMNGKVDDVRLPFSTVDPIMGDMYSVLWEPEMLQSMGDTIRILATEALTQGLQQLAASTIAASLIAALSLPIVLTKLSYLIDNPWSVSCDRANSAGLILADSLVDRNLGARPITLVGFSLGSRLIFSCLRELANKGAVGLVQNVYLFGSPVVANKDDYLRARTVVSGRFVNGYATNDWILAYLFRATSGGISRVAGINPVLEIPGLENIDVTPFVKGHMLYRTAMPRLLREVGWAVESDEFSEIVDPDPDNHEKRQRELISEIDEARKEAETKPEKRKWGIFKRGKVPQKKGWETYDERSKEGLEDGGEGSGAAHANQNVLFDIDAIRAELASEQMEVKQLESTLPPMKLDLEGSTASRKGSTETSTSQQQSPRDHLRETKSYNETTTNANYTTISRPPDPSPAYHQAHPNGGHPSFPSSQHDPASSSSSPTPCSAEAEAEIQLTFSPPSPSKTFDINTPPTSLLPPSATSSMDSPIALKDSKPIVPNRPALRSVVTTPLPKPRSLQGISIEHNAWAEDEDENEVEGLGVGVGGGVGAGVRASKDPLHHQSTSTWGKSSSSLQQHQQQHWQKEEDKEEEEEERLHQREHINGTQGYSSTLHRASERNEKAEKEAQKEAEVEDPNDPDDIFGDEREVKMSFE